MEDMEQTQIVCIPDENGIEQDFEVIMTFEMEQTGAKYMLVAPLDGGIDGDEESDEVFAFRFEEEGDELILHTIVDEDEWKSVEEVFDALLADEQEESAKTDNE